MSSSPSPFFLKILKTFDAVYLMPLRLPLKFLMWEVEYLVIAVRNVYRKHKDFEIIHTFLETLYISNRLHLPLKGILLIGY